MLLAAAGLGAAVYGLLKTSVWAGSSPSRGPDLLGLSPSIWLIAAGLVIVWLFFLWQHHLEGRGREPLLSPSLLENRQLSGGLISFFFQFLLQAGVFFLVPLFLSVVLGLSALQTGVRLLPLSLALLVAAAGVPKLFPKAPPQRVVRLGLLAILLGIVALMTGIDLDATAAIVAVPMLLIGAGIGALASQLGSVTVSAVPDERSPVVGGLQNTVTNLGASVGTAVAGSILILILTNSFVMGIQQDPAVPDEVKQQATVELSGGIPFIADSDLETAMADAGASAEVTQAVLDANAEGRVAGLKTALAVLAIVGVVALFATRRIPRTPVGHAGPAPPDKAAPATETTA